MVYEGLKQFLPAYVAIFLIIPFFWSKVSKRDTLLIENKLDDVNSVIFSIYKRFFSYFRIILLLYSFLIIVFCYFPLYYKAWLLPFDEFNIILIKGIGFHLLKIVIIWLIVVQVFLDRLYKRNLNKRNQKLILKAHDIVLIGMLMLFSCYALIITNIFSLGLILIALLFYIYIKLRVQLIRQVE